MTIAAILQCKGSEVLTIALRHVGPRRGRLLAERKIGALPVLRAAGSPASCPSATSSIA